MNLNTPKILCSYPGSVHLLPHHKLIHVHLSYVTAPHLRGACSFLQFIQIPFCLPNGIGGEYKSTAFVPNLNVSSTVDHVVAHINTSYYTYRFYVA